MKGYPMTDMTGKKVMLLVANGFAQMDFITLQREMSSLKAEMTVVSSEKNLVNGFNGAEWGLTFPVDQQIDTVLGSDFDAVIIVGGPQSVKRLQDNPHTARILEAFAESNKPVILMNEAKSFDVAGSTRVMEIDGEVTDETVVDVIMHITGSEVMAKAA